MEVFSFQPKALNKPGLGFLSDLTRLKKHRSIQIHSLGGINSNNQEIFKKNKHRVDKLASAHFQNFSHYILKY